MSLDLAASIRARLKNVADARKQDFNLVLTHYGLERLPVRCLRTDQTQYGKLGGSIIKRGNV